MQSMQKAVQLTTFCVKSKNKSINVVSFKKCYNICDISCIYGRYKNLILFLKFGAMHFIYQINRLTTTKVDSTYLG